jgi:hypothetical protein
LQDSGRGDGDAGRCTPSDCKTLPSLTPDQDESMEFALPRQDDGEFDRQRRVHVGADRH